VHGEAPHTQDGDDGQTQDLEQLDPFALVRQRVATATACIGQ